MRAIHVFYDIIKKVICHFKKSVLKSSLRAGLKVNHGSYFAAHTRSVRRFFPVAEPFQGNVIDAYKIYRISLPCR